MSIWDLAEFALKCSYSCTGIFFLKPEEATVIRSQITEERKYGLRHVVQRWLLQEFADIRAANFARPWLMCEIKTAPE